MHFLTTDYWHHEREGMRFLATAHHGRHKLIVYTRQRGTEWTCSLSVSKAGATGFTLVGRAATMVGALRAAFQLYLQHFEADALKADEDPEDIDEEDDDQDDEDTGGVPEPLPV